jgi:hypothetical protein
MASQNVYKWVPVESLTETLFYLVILCLACHSYFQSGMTDMNAIRVIAFCGKLEEWPIWSKRFLAKAKRCGFNALLLGKLSIPKVDEEIDETSDKGGRKKVGRGIKYKFKHRQCSI